jgi:hypothetical protein
MTKPKKPTQPPYAGRQSGASLESWVWVMHNMIAEVIHRWPAGQQIEVLDGLLQAIVQRLNWLRDREAGK